MGDTPCGALYILLLRVVVSSKGFSGGGYTVKKDVVSMINSYFSHS